MSDIYRCILCIVGFSMTKLHSHRVKLRLGKDGFDDETSSWVLSHLGPFCWFLDCPWLSIYPCDSICLSMSTWNYIHVGHVALQGETVHHSHPWPVDRRGLSTALADIRWPCIGAESFDVGEIVKQDSDKNGGTNPFILEEKPMSYHVVI